MFFAGDTALPRPPTRWWNAALVAPTGARSRAAADRLAPAWKPGFRRGHLTGEDALALFETLRARAMMPYHWGTFHHVTSSAHDAIDRLRTRLGGYERRSRVHVIEPGESLTLGAAARA